MARIATVVATVIGLATVSLATLAQMGMKAEDVIQKWKPMPRQVAMKMIKKYGQPQEVTARRLIWHGNGPWKRTILVDEEIDHHFPMPHKDMLEQFIDLKVPAGKFDDLAAYDGSVIVERTKGEISARCDKEEANFLAVNLAYDIAQNKRTVADARRFYADTIMRMMKGTMQATHKRYTSGFVFSPPRSNQGDKDKPAKGG